MRDHEVDARFFTHRPTVYPEVPSSTKSNQPSLENTLARDFAIEAMNDGRLDIKRQKGAMTVLT